MWEFIDKIVYINLDHREDRRQIMQKLFDEGQIPPEKIHRFSAIKHKFGIVGCSMSHISVLKLAKEQKWKNVLIMEDDLTWKDFEENYKQLETLPEFDVCMIGGQYLEKSNLKVTGAFYTNAYIVSSHYYDTLLDNFETGLSLKLDKKMFSFGSLEKKNKLYENMVNEDYWNCLDVYWIKLQLRDNWIGISMIEQVPTYSDLYNKDVDHANTTIHTHVINSIFMDRAKAYFKIEK